MLNEPRINYGGVAWLGLALGIAGYDTWAMWAGAPTMSTAFRSGVSHPSWRWVVGSLWAVTTLHLFGVIPHRCDPFHGYGVLLARVRR